MDFITLLNFEEQLLNFINDRNDVMLQHKYFIVSFIAEKIKNTLLNNNLLLEDKTLYDIAKLYNHKIERVFLKDWQSIQKQQKEKNSSISKD